MQLHIEPDLSIPLPPDDIPFADFKERAEAACKTAELLELDTSSSEEEKSAAEQLVYEYAQNPDKTSKAVAKTPAKVTPAIYRDVKDLLDEFSVRVVDSAVQIRLLVTNRLLLETSDPDPRIRLRALELLGKITDVGLFTEKSEVTIHHRSTKELTESLRAKIEKLRNPVGTEDAKNVQVHGKTIDVDAALGLETEENTVANTNNNAD